MKEEIILMLVQYQIQIKFMHWQTFGDAKHRAYGQLYDFLNEAIDEFVETMMGKYERPIFPPEFPLTFQDFNSMDAEAFCEGFADYLISFTDRMNPKLDSDLLNQRDEMLGELNRIKYLLTLKY